MQNNDLISRSALLKSFKRSCLGDCEFCPRAIYSPDEPEIICGLIQCAPAVDAEPVRHGRWIDRGDYVTTAYGSLDLKICSECNAEVTLDGYDYYCPNCGCKMDWGENDAFD